MITAESTTRGICPSQRNRTAPAISNAAALISTDSGVRAAERPVGDAGTDVDAAGDSADARSGDVADTKANEKPVTVTAWLAGSSHELCAQERINRSNNGQRQRAAEDRGHERQKIAAARYTFEVLVGRQAHGRARHAGNDRA